MPIILGPGEQRELNVALMPTTVRNATLFGYVTDADTGLPIAGALVALTGGYSVLTNSGGYYELEVPPGTYSGQITADGYEPYTF